MFKVIFSLLLIQYNADPIRTAEQAPKMVQAQARAIAEANKRQEAWQRRTFEERFNALVKAAGAFAERYNESGGNVWPQREATALDKALADLQKTRELKPNKPRAQGR